MFASRGYKRRALFLSDMIAKQGQNIIIGTVFQPTSGTFNLADYDVRLHITTLRGETVLSKTNNIIRNDVDNAVACTITADETKDMKGLYFLTFELLANGDVVLSNEVEQLTVIK